MNQNALFITAVLCMLCREVKLQCSPGANLPQEVQDCPMSENEVKKAAKRLKCEEKCGRLEYHCLPDTNIEKFYELCFTAVYIIGKRCAEYNKDGGVIQANRYNSWADCGNFTNPCPEIYHSSESYKYTECFKRPLINTPVADISMSNTETVKNRKMTTTSKDSSGESDEITKTVVIVIISFIVLVSFLSFLIPASFICYEKFSMQITWTQACRNVKACVMQFFVCQTSEEQLGDVF